MTSPASAPTCGYVRDLGVDAIWLNPWYVSPQADAGYDVADYRDIDPVFGTLADAEALITEAHELGIRVIVDIVPNHCSDQHPWFRAALAAGPGSPERQRFVFRPGRGVDGDEPPNNWLSNFAGSSWTRVTEADGTPGEWYLHQFAPEQPDFNWANPEVHAEFEAILRFWLDRGVDGFRIDVAHGLVKAAGLPDAGPDDRRGWMPFEDQDGVHDIWREWRRITDSYPGERVLVGEVWVPDPERFSRYLRRDELHSAFNFDFLRCAVGRDADARRHQRDAGHPRAGRRAGDLGAVQPRRAAARDPLRSGRHVVRVRAQPARRADRSRGGHPSGPSRGAAHPRPSRRRVRLPGRRARPLGGRGHPGRASAGSDVGAVRPPRRRT